MRWSELSSVWQACVEEAWAAYCAGSLPIGAVITAPDGHIVARGRNRLFEQTAAAPYLYGRLAHAEMNAIRALELGGHLPVESTIYSTLEPCPMCLGAIRINGFKAVHFAAHDVNAGSDSLLAATDFMRKEAPLLVKPQNEKLEIFLLALLAETVLRLELPRGSADLVLRGERCPDAVKFGRALHQSGELVDLKRQEADGATMFAYLAEQRI